MIHISKSRAVAETALEITADSKEDIELLRRIGREKDSNTVRMTDARRGVLRIIIKDQKKK